VLAAFTSSDTSRDVCARAIAVGPALPRQEFELRAYLSLGATMHDTAIVAW
jgi:hypothetical protein